MSGLARLGLVIESKADFKNPLFRLFSIFSSRRAGGLARLGIQAVPRQAVQRDDISLQNLARCAMAAALRKPTDGVAWSCGCTTPGVCTKKGHKARRREGDKCFFFRVFFQLTFFWGYGSMCTIQTDSGDSPMPSYTFEEKSSMRRHMQVLVSDVENSQSAQELSEHSTYAAAFLADLPGNDVCTDEEAAEWGFQLGLAKAQATERLENLV